MSQKISLSRLVAINAVVCGVEIATGAAFTFIPPLLLKAGKLDNVYIIIYLHFLQVGYSEAQMSIILGVAPFLALFTVPILGKKSDSCTNRFDCSHISHIDNIYFCTLYCYRYGRRRPFIFVFSFILMMSLLLLYFSQSLTEQDSSTKQLRMVLLAVAVILLDYAIQAIINPCGALMSDLMAGQQNEAQGFTVV